MKRIFSLSIHIRILAVEMLKCIFYGGDKMLQIGCRDMQNKPLLEIINYCIGLDNYSFHEYCTNNLMVIHINVTILR